MAGRGGRGSSRSGGRTATLQLVLVRRRPTRVLRVVMNSRRRGRRGSQVVRVVVVMVVVFEGGGRGWRRGTEVVVVRERSASGVVWRTEVFLEMKVWVIWNNLLKKL